VTGPLVSTYNYLIGDCGPVGGQLALMENLRLTARNSVQAGDLTGSVTLDEDANCGLELISLYALWADVSAHLTRDTHGTVVRPTLNSACSNFQLNSLVILGK
jgi:hypothetical protein